MAVRAGLVTCVVILLALSFPSLIAAQETSPEESEAPAAGELPPSAERVVSPMMQEILDLQASSDERLAELKAELDAALDFEEKLRLRRAIQDQKRDAEIEMFRIQLRHAEKRGDRESARELEQNIRALEDPEAYLAERLEEARQQSIPQAQ